MTCECRVEQQWPPTITMGVDAAGAAVGTMPSHRIVYCPLHAAAERLAGALGEVLSVLDGHLHSEWDACVEGDSTGSAAIDALEAAGRPWDAHRCRP